MSRTLDRSVSPRHRAPPRRHRFSARGNGAVVFETGRRYSWGRRGDTYYIWNKRHPGDVLEHSWEANARREFRWLEQEAAQRRRRRWRRVAIAAGLVLIVLVLVAVAMKASDDPSAASEPAARGRGGARYTNVGGGYGFLAPMDWSVVSASSTAQVTSPGGSITISIQVAPEGAVGAASEAFVRDLAAAWSEARTEAPQPRPVGDLPGLSVGGTAVDEAGDAIRFLSIVVDSGARNHAISVSVPREWNESMFMPAVDVVLSSFEPLDAS